MLSMSWTTITGRSGRTPTILVAALYSSMARKVPHPQSAIALASLRLRTMFLTARSSTAEIVIVQDEAGRGLVQEISRRRDLGFGAGGLALAFTRTQPRVAAGHPPLIAGQVPGPPFQVPGIGDPLPVAGDREVGDP